MNAGRLDSLPPARPPVPEPASLTIADVGNGLSNQTFIEGPEGIIAIDTGESVEEMRSARAELRKVTDRPVVAVISTHFHYVAGTRAVVEEAGHELPVHGHRRIAVNRSRTATEIAPAYGRGLVEQFGVSLPTDGPDGLVNVGLGQLPMCCVTHRR